MRANPRARASTACVSEAAAAAAAAYRLHGAVVYVYDTALTPLCYYQSSSHRRPQFNVTSPNPQVNAC